MYEGVFSPIPDPGAYLARIGLEPDDYRKALHPELPDSPSAFSARHSKDALDVLVRAHLMSVPFEDLDIYELGREVSLEIDDVFDKIVRRRRGGFCFELNGLFCALLEALGFECRAIAVRVLFEGEFPPTGHRSTIVTLADGKRVVCDVGFGGPTPLGALYLDCADVQHSGRLAFRYEKRPDGLYKFTYIQRDGAEMPLHLFSDSEFSKMDFVALGVYMSRGDHARFRNERVLNILRENGSAAIQDDTLRLHNDGVLTEIELKTASERKAAYIKYFGMPGESLTELPG